jgi:hypothetical protein
MDPMMLTELPSNESEIEVNRTLPAGYESAEQLGATTGLGGDRRDRDEGVRCGQDLN